MKKNIITIIVGIFCIFLGSAGMYLLIYYYPNVIVDKIEEKKVTVTDTGIAEGINNIYDMVVVVEGFNNGNLVSSGSGFIYEKNNKNAYIMTNHHVVENATEFKITTMDGKNIKAILKGSDEYADIAVLEIDGKNIDKVAIIGNSQNMRVGDTVFTIGAPMGKEFAGTVTRGILSGKNRMVEISYDWIMNVMQTDAAINPGNSGGPLCNINGEVIGINSLKIVESSIEGIGFAIPIEDALNFANKLKVGEKIFRAFIGIEMMNVRDAGVLSKYGLTLDSSIKEGVIISNVIENSPADNAKLKKGDVIVKLGNYDVSTIAELRYYLYKHEPGDKVEFKLYRDNDYINIKVTLGEAS